MTADDLHQSMQRLGMTEAQLAAALGVTRSAVYRWLSGERGVPPYLWRALRDLERERAG